MNRITSPINTIVALVVLTSVLITPVLVGAAIPAKPKPNPAPRAERISTYPSIYRMFDPATGVACYIYQSAGTIACLQVQENAEILGGDRAPAGTPAIDPRVSRA